MYNYGISWEQREDIFYKWLKEKEAYIKSLMDEGYTKNQAIELLKIQALECVSECIVSK